MKNVAVKTGVGVSCSAHDVYKKSYPSEFFSLFGGATPENYCRWIWQTTTHHVSGKKINYYGVLGRSDRARKYDVPSINDFYLRSPWASNIDTYWTPNTFSAWRTSRTVAELCATVIDIDVVRQLSQQEEDQILTEIMERLESSQIPLPNAIVRSGSGGLHLYYPYSLTLNAKDYQNRSLWRDVAIKITDSLSEGSDLWYVDRAASCSPERVFRLPGSMHTGSRKRAIPYIASFPKLSLAELANRIGIKQHQATQPVSFQQAANTRTVTVTVTRKEVAPRPNYAGQIQRHTLRGYWARVYWHLSSHIRQHGLKKGTRDSGLFITFVAAQHVTNTQQALEEIKRIRKECVPDFSETELMSNLGSAIKTRYCYSKKRLREFLEDAGIPVPDFLLGATVRWKAVLGLSVNEIKRRQKAAGKNTATTRRERTVNTLKSLYEAAKAQSKPITQTLLASLSGLARSTISRYWSLLHTVSYIPAPPYS